MADCHIYPNVVPAPLILFQFQSLLTSLKDFLIVSRVTSGSAAQEVAIEQAMADWYKPENPQALLASVTESLQRFTHQLQPHRLGLPHALKAAPAQLHGLPRPGKGECSGHQVVVEDEGVLTPVQVGDSASVHRPCMTRIVMDMHEAAVPPGRCATTSTEGQLCLALHWLPSWAAWATSCVTTIPA